MTGSDKTTALLRLVGWRIGELEPAPDAVAELTAELFHEHRDAVIRYLYVFRLPMHSCEEIAQQTFFKLFLHLREGKPRDNLASWIFRVAHNEALKTKSRPDPSRFVPLQGTGTDLRADPEPDAEQNMIATERRERLRAVVAALGEQERQCLFLRAEGLRYREIAEVLGVAVGTVSSLLTRALDRLKRADEGHHGER